MLSLNTLLSSLSIIAEAVHAHHLDPHCLVFLSHNPEFGLTMAHGFIIKGKYSDDFRVALGDVGLTLDDHGKGVGVR